MQYLLTEASNFGINSSNLTPQSTPTFTDLSGLRCFILKDNKRDERQKIKHRWVHLVLEAALNHCPPGDCLDFIFKAVFVTYWEEKGDRAEVMPDFNFWRNEMPQWVGTERSSLLCSHTLIGESLHRLTALSLSSGRKIFACCVEISCHITPPTIGFTTCCLFHFIEYFLAWERHVYHTLLLSLSVCESDINIQYLLGYVLL